MSGATKPPGIKLSLPLLTAIICTFAFIALLYTERISLLSSSNIFKLKSCPKRNAAKPKKLIADDKQLESRPISDATDDRFEFDPEECSLTDGKWVFNTSIKPLYTDSSCPYVDRQFSCVKNGREDSDYRHWVWLPDDCILPSFDPENALRKIQGKRMMFVGDSLQRNQWQSFVCLVDSVIPENQKSMKRGRVHSVFRVKEYNATIEFYWAPFLVESNTDIQIIADSKKRIIKVDSISRRAKHWLGVDILVFNTYVWWMSGLKSNALYEQYYPYLNKMYVMKCRWGSFKNGDDGYEAFDTPVSYRLALRTWANWIDSNINPNKAKVFFTTMSPTHTRSADWGKEDGLKCFNETRPVTKKGHWGTGSNLEMMSVVSSVMKRMKFPVTFINITQLSEYRIDGHASIYNELGGKLLTDEQKADPLNYADCIHWCLPGVPDTWNQILYAYL